MGVLTILDLWNPWGYVSDMLSYHGGLENIVFMFKNIGFKGFIDR